MTSLDEGCLDRAIALFDAANAQDPRRERDGDEVVPKELLYARRMSAMLERFSPGAAVAVRLAVRAQHIERWKLPRSDYPMSPEGYKAWRSRLYALHADTAARLMAEAGCEADTIERVRAAVGKRGIKVNPDSQAVEDVASLVFLEYVLADFAAGHPEYDEAKWIDILRKTWRKMSEAARSFALSGKLRLPADLLPLIVRATAGEPEARD